MGVIDKVKALPTPMFILFVSSKVIGGIGIGVLLGQALKGLGWWILLLGVILSIPPAIKIFGKQR